MNTVRSKYAYSSKKICLLCYIRAGVETLPCIHHSTDAMVFFLSDNLCQSMVSYCLKNRLGNTMGGVLSTLSIFHPCFSYYIIRAKCECLPHESGLSATTQVENSVVP